MHCSWMKYCLLGIHIAVLSFVLFICLESKFPAVLKQNLSSCESGSRRLIHDVHCKLGVVDKRFSVPPPKQAGYAVENVLFEQLASTPDLVNLSEADLILVGHSATALMHHHKRTIRSRNGINGTINPRRVPTQHLDQVLEEVHREWNFSAQIAVVMSHDHGNRLLPVKYQSTVISLQNDGDYSPNLNHFVIVVFPAGKLSDIPVVPLEYRLKKVFFAGTVDRPLPYSFGLRQAGKVLYGNSSYVDFFPSKVENYIRTLAQYTFCLYIPGWASWSHRLFDLIERACIPVIVFDRSALPSEQFVQWSTFSVFISEDEFLRGDLDSIIGSISSIRYTRMFENLLRLRSFLYNREGYTESYIQLVRAEMCIRWRRRTRSHTRNLSDL